MIKTAVSQDELLVVEIVQTEQVSNEELQNPSLASLISPLFHIDTRNQEPDTEMRRTVSSEQVAIIYGGRVSYRQSAASSTEPERVQYEDNRRATTSHYQSRPPQVPT